MTDMIFTTLKQIRALDGFRLAGSSHARQVSSHAPSDFQQEGIEMSDNNMSSREWQNLEQNQKDIISRYQAETPVRLGALANELGLIVMSSTLEP